LDGRIAPLLWQPKNKMGRNTLYYQKNKDKISQKAKIYYQKNKKKILTKRKEYYYSEKGKEIRERNREKRRTYEIKYEKEQKEHKEQINIGKRRRWKKNPKGYVSIHKLDHKYSKTKTGWIKKHRAVVEDFLKRALKPGEVVHHINEIKDDNRIENLMLFKNQREHSSFHTKIRQFGMTTPIRRQIENRWNL